MAPKPGYAVARAPRKGGRATAVEVYDPVTDLMAAQAEYEAAKVRWDAAVIRRNHAAARAYKVGKLGWTNIGVLLGKVTNQRAQEIARPRKKRNKETKP